MTLQEQAEAITDWPVDTTLVARAILQNLGIGDHCSLEPGDYRRDRICRLIEVEIERRCTLVQEDCAKVVEEMDRCEPNQYDNGSTEDGYRQAKTHILAAIRSRK